MAIKRRLRRNSLKDILETFYFGSRRFSKELKIQQQFLQKKTLHYRKNFSYMHYCKFKFNCLLLFFVEKRLICVFLI